MNFEESIFRAAFLVLVFSGIPLAAASLVGLFVAVFQTATQVQEQTVNFSLKFITCCLVIFLIAAPSLAALEQFFNESIGKVVEIGRF